MARTLTALGMTAAASALLVTIGCTTSTPLAPTPPTSTGGAGADGSTLKVTAPTTVSPTGSQTLTNLKPTMTIAEASGQFASKTFSYEFELQSDAGAVVRAEIRSGTTWAFPDNLQADTPYKWRARAALDGAVGPWSALARFVTGRLLTVPNKASSNDEWRVYFFAIIDLRGVGPIGSRAALAVLEPDLNAGGALVQHDGAGNIRGRLYLPSDAPPVPFGRPVDVSAFDNKPWGWFPR